MHSDDPHTYTSTFYSSGCMSGSVLFQTSYVNNSILFWNVLIIMAVQWTLTNPNSLGPELVQISEIFGLISERIHFDWGSNSVLFNAHQNSHEYH